jgi:predicted nucleic acid-binding protein
MDYVIDATVACAWYFPHPYAQAARRVYGGDFTLCAPDLIYVELGNAIWKQCQFASLNPFKALLTLEAFDTHPLLITPSRELLKDAFAVASETGRTVYDSLYLALATSIDLPLVTGDKKFFNSLQKTKYAANLIWVEDLPSS